MGATEESVRRRARVLAGFMSEPEADGFAKSFAIEPDAFMASWRGVTRPPAPVANMAVPRIEDVPPEAVAHVTELLAHPLFEPNYGKGATIKMVELGRLLVMQHWMDIDASGAVHGSKMNDDGIASLLDACLSLEKLRPSVDVRWSRFMAGPPGRPVVIVLTGHTLDNSYGVKDLRQETKDNLINITLASNANLMLVREWGGRYVLSQGYHRAWMLRARGVAMVPAVVVRLPNPGDLAPPPLIQHVLSNRPPMIDDFLNDAVSVDVDVRSTMTAVKITIETSIVPRLL